MSRTGFATRRRTELFDELLDLLLRDGFAHLTLDEIAARLRCSKSTLYTLAGSKDELVRAVTVHYFRNAAADVEARIAEVDGPRARITAYLEAVGAMLATASEQFMADLDAFAPAREVYEQNTRFAAARVQELITEGVDAGAFRSVHAAFAADLAAATMARIQQGAVRAATGLDDAHAYRELAAILTQGISAGQHP
ncbi:MAG TPA: TetR/AcrR family transcriptional regulator [Aldersonia sp.]